MGKLYYFQAPNFDINPNSAIAPKLGSIFLNLDTLTAPLNQNEIITVPESLINQSSYPDFKETEGRNFDIKAGLNVNAGQGITGTAELMYSFAHNKKNVYECELLSTTEFAPNDEYVSDSIAASPRVRNFLENSLIGRKRVYMITGLKIASGFSKSETKESKQGPKLKVGASVFAAPVELGPELGVTIGKARTVEHGQTTNQIVFAYRVIRIKLKRDGEAKYKYKSGGKYAVDEDSDEDKEDGWEMEQLNEEDILNDFPGSVKIEVESLEVE